VCVLVCACVCFLYAGPEFSKAGTSPPPLKQAHTHTVTQRQSAEKVTNTRKYCNTLQHTVTLTHTATHCNTHTHRDKTLVGGASHRHKQILQHTATHCNALQHTATHCNTHTPRQSAPGGGVSHGLLSRPRLERVVAFVSNTTATRCHTMQPTATHFNLLRHGLLSRPRLERVATFARYTTAIHCKTLQLNASWPLEPFPPRRSSQLCLQQRCITLHHCNALQNIATHCVMAFRAVPA